MNANSAQPPAPDSDDPALQGEGNYTAARRHRESVENFVDSGKVDEAARDAAPKDPTEQRDMQQAEEAGRARAKK